MKNMENYILLLFIFSFFIFGFGCVSQVPQNQSPGQPVTDLTNTAMKLSWPIGCKVGINCTSILFPDIEKNGMSRCGFTGYTGHEGTDIGISWEDMDKGVDVYAAADGKVLWVFDGKYNRCVNNGIVLVKTDNPDCNDPTGAPQPGTSSGYRVCTESGDYCNAELKAEGKTSNIRCFWCFDGGNVIVILHDANKTSGVFATRYDHLKNGSILVKPGDYVVAGQKIAEVGSAGHSSGPHLHFEVWSDFYKPIDPWSDSCDPKKVFSNYS